MYNHAFVPVIWHSLKAQEAKTDEQPATFISQLTRRLSYHNHTETDHSVLKWKDEEHNLVGRIYKSNVLYDWKVETFCDLGMKFLTVIDHRAVSLRQLRWAARLLHCDCAVSDHSIWPHSPTRQASTVSKRTEPLMCYWCISKNWCSRLQHSISVLYVLTIVARSGERRMTWACDGNFRARYSRKAFCCTR